MVVRCVRLLRLGRLMTRNTCIHRQDHMQLWFNRTTMTYSCGSTTVLWFDRITGTCVCGSASEMPVDARPHQNVYRCMLEVTTAPLIQIEWLGVLLQVLNTHVSSEKAGPQQNMAADHRDLWTTSEYKPAIYIYSDTPVGQNLNICQFYQRY